MECGMPEISRASFERARVEARRMIDKMEACATAFDRLAILGHEAVCASRDAIARTDAILDRSIRRAPGRR